MSRVIVDVNLLDAVAPADIPQTIATLAAAILSLAARSDQAPPQRDRDTGEGFLTIEALSQRLGLAEQTIRNLVHRGELLQGVHYFKPTGRLLFDWCSIEAWVRERGNGRLR
jgi:hypothetical protein